MVEKDRIKPYLRPDVDQPMIGMGSDRVTSLLVSMAGEIYRRMSDERLLRAVEVLKRKNKPITNDLRKVLKERGLIKKEE